MPNSAADAIRFLETQWSGTGGTKVLGTLGEIALRNYLYQQKASFIGGGWLLTPGKATLSPVPAASRICLLPRTWRFSWQSGNQGLPSAFLPAEIAAYNLFSQVGIATYFATPQSPDQTSFLVPRPKSSTHASSYPIPYHLDLQQISTGTGAPVSAPPAAVFALFPKRVGKSGLKCHQVGTISPTSSPWNDYDSVANLFWHAYTKYYFQIPYLTANSDLDFFLVGKSGRCYPLEVKSKGPANDPTLGPWFGIDVGSYVKLSFFTSNAFNSDALYVVQEVDPNRNHLNWLAIKFNDLVKSCSWVIQGGGRSGISGGGSVTIKIPRAAFSQLSSLLTSL